MSLNMNPAYRMSVSESDLDSIISKMVEKKGWDSYEIKDLRLVYEPLWVFNFYAYTVKGMQKNENLPELKEIVDSEFSGKAAINAYSMELFEGIEHIITNHKFVPTKDIELAANQEAKPVMLNIEEAIQIAKLRVASLNSVPKNHVVVSGMTLICMPMYYGKLHLPVGDYDIHVEAVEGNFTSVVKLPSREKTPREISFDTINSLKSPVGWIENFALLLSSIIGFVSKYKLFSLIILILILAVIYLQFF